MAATKQVVASGVMPFGDLLPGDRFFVATHQLGGFAEWVTVTELLWLEEDDEHGHRVAVVVATDRFAQVRHWSDAPVIASIGGRR